MDIDGDGGRRGFGLRGQRRGTESIVAEMVERRERMGVISCLWTPICDSRLNRFLTWLEAARLICSPANGGHLTKGEIKYAWAFPRIIRLEKTLQNSIRARFTAGLALQTGCLVVPDLTPLLTKIRTLIHEEISLPWRTLFPRSSNDPYVAWTSI